MRTLKFKLPFDHDLEAYLRSSQESFSDFRIRSKSLDARGASRGKKPFYHYNVELIEEGENFAPLFEPLEKVKWTQRPPVIIGAGPAGLFCALRFAQKGVPCILVERGAPANKRMLHIAKYWKKGELDPDSNVCYGEGGAGLFSDGKLITRVKSPLVKWVMQKFVDYGAPEETAYIANPHLGSNRIRKIITKITDDLKTMDCQVRTGCRVDELIFEGKQVRGVKLSSGEEILSDHVILATGHSAKEMYQHLSLQNVQMKLKDFAIGVRIEHPRKYLDHLQYGCYQESPHLGAARYRLSYHNQHSDKGTYSFCMCPGGYVLSTSTDKKGIVVNGMSNYSRSSPWSNAALVVTVKADQDVPGEGVQKGLEFIESIEEKAFELSKKYATGRELPAMSVGEFMKGKLSDVELPKTSSPSHIFKCDLYELFPKFITDHLKEALREFDKKLPGFNYDQALLIAPETRTSAPITIERDRHTLESLSHQGLYPAGEGAGYAGGITSAAVDGIKICESIIQKS